MRFVPLKSEQQRDLQALQRVRDRIVGRCTAVINQIRLFCLSVEDSGGGREPQNRLKIHRQPKNFASS